MPHIDDPSLALLFLMFLPNLLVFLHLVVTDCVYRTWSLLREDDVRERRNEATLGGHRRRRGGSGGGGVGWGVPEEARRGWERYAWGTGGGSGMAATDLEAGGKNYGSMDGIRTIISIEGEKAETKNIDPCPASEMERGTLPADIIDGDQPACSICLGEYAHGETVVRLPCGHIYHGPCIESWTDRDVRCPLCNLDLTLEYKHALVV